MNAFMIKMKRDIENFKALAMIQARCACLRLL